MSSGMLFRPTAWRTATRLVAVGVGVGVGQGTCFGAGITSPIRLDAYQSPRRPHSWHQQIDAKPSQQRIKQVSSGSLAGTVSVNRAHASSTHRPGLVAAVVATLFSRTLLVVGGMFVVIASQLASRRGLESLRLLGLNPMQWPGVPSLATIGAEYPWFASSFVFTFILAAFVQL
ncbi:hypothetical protein DCS_08025 [Drechmeria coniospora]|uniref:Uncharacterized protein n=1 Tax=Drechmeria coniospora TaxID=98403 RepID=A0A151GG41_DRECN|nr:hypothetical protein DCS_08025 [Drechmeria coniospora]KYK56059.1 hypothetical protein DCS_08025 [Drechmeria coniospora]